MEPYPPFEDVIYAPTAQEWSVKKEGKTGHFKDLMGSLIFGNPGASTEEARHTVVLLGAMQSTKQIVIVHEFQTEDLDEFAHELVNMKDFFQITQFRFLPDDEAVLRTLRRTDGLTYYNVKGITDDGKAAFSRKPAHWKYWRRWSLTAMIAPFHAHLLTSTNVVLKRARAAFQQKLAAVLPHCRHSLMIQNKRWTDAKKDPLVLAIGFGTATRLMLDDTEEWNGHDTMKTEWKEPYPSRWGKLG